MRILSIAFIVILLLSCDNESMYPSCPITKSIREDCDQKENSCIIEEHPNCQHGICLVYKYKDIVSQDIWSTGPFCSQKCEQNQDCPEKASCIEILGNFYCIPQTYLKSDLPAQ